MTVLGEALDGVVVARIVECAKHPEADTPAGLPGRCRQRRAAADRLRRAERAPGPGRAAGDDRHAGRRHHHQGGEAARRRIERHAVLGEGTRPRRRCLRPAGTAGRRAGRHAAGRLPRPAGRQHRTEAHAEPRRLLQRARHRVRRRRRLRQRSRAARCHADAGAERRDARRSNSTPAPMRRATSAA